MILNHSLSHATFPRSLLSISNPPKKTETAWAVACRVKARSRAGTKDEGNKVVDLSNSNDANDDVGRGEILARENLVC